MPPSRHLLVRFRQTALPSTLNVSLLCASQQLMQEADYDGSTTILTWKSSPAVCGSVGLNDLLGLEQVVGCKISTRIFPWMKFREHGTCRQQLPENLSATFALLKQIALSIKPWLLNNAVRKTSSCGIEQSESEMKPRPTNAKKETPITVFRSMGFQSRTAKR